MSEETKNDEGTGIGLLVAAYVDERGADNALAQLKQAKKADQFYYENAAVVRRSAEGKMHTKETGDMSTGKGAGIGALIGGVIGVVEYFEWRLSGLIRVVFRMRFPITSIF